MDAFVSGAGTGGTIAGVSRLLKSKNPGVKVFLIDPPGSGLYNKVGPAVGLWAGPWVLAVFVARLCVVLCGAREEDGLGCTAMPSPGAWC